MCFRGIPLIAPLTRLVEAQIRQSFTFAIYIARELNPTSIQKNLWEDVYRRNDPTPIQEERSEMYTERAKLGFKRSDNRLIFRDNNGSMPPVMGTGKSY